jgi:hypothetical protein
VVRRQRLLIVLPRAPPLCSSTCTVDLPRVPSCFMALGIWRFLASLLHRRWRLGRPSPCRRAAMPRLVVVATFESHHLISPFPCASWSSSYFFVSHSFVHCCLIVLQPFLPACYCISFQTYLHKYTTTRAQKELLSTGYTNNACSSLNCVAHMHTWECLPG